MSHSNSRRSFITKSAIAAAMTPFAALSTFGREYEQAVDRTPKASPPTNLKITEVKCGYIRGSLFVKIYTNQDIWARRHIHGPTPLRRGRKPPYAAQMVCNKDWPGWQCVVPRPARHIFADQASRCLRHPFQAFA